MVKQLLISFAKSLNVTASPRGYVSVSVEGTDISIVKDLEPNLKRKLIANYDTMSTDEANAAWKEAMKVLEVQAIEEAKKAWNIYRKKTR